MALSDTKSWAEGFAAELIVDGEHIPFERVLARHLDTITTLRKTAGHTWPGIASLLVRAGARRSDGGLISSDQIRVSYSRLVRQPRAVNQRRQASPEVVKRPGQSSAGEKSTLRSVGPSAHIPLAASKPTGSTSIQPTFNTNSDEDISSDDIQSALERLGKLNKK
jgi:hypothetical protein